MSGVDYENIDGPGGTDDNMGGLTQRAYYAPIADFLSIKKTAPTPTDLAGLVEITTAHTFKTGKCFKTIYCTMDKGKLDDETQGETDGKSMKCVAEIFVPGSKKTAFGFAAQVKNDNMIWLFEHPDSADNGYLQIGSEMFPAKVDPAFTTGTNSGGVKGHTFKVYAMSPRQYVYSAAVTLTPAA